MHPASSRKPSPGPVLQINDLHVHFPLPAPFFSRQQPKIHALNGVSFDVNRGETFCLVGESGCGKTTLGRAVAGLVRANTGSISYEGQRIDQLNDRQRKPFRQRIQMIFQNPYASLNPRMTVRQTLEEPLRFHRPQLRQEEISQRTREIMLSVGNDPDWANRYPHEFSGGQRQRISIARALMIDPEFIIADEPISALDVSIQAQVLNVLTQAQQEHQLTYLFITHDLSVVRHLASRVAVMYLGKICEIARAEDLFAHPRHPYTQLLLSAIPKIGGKPVSMNYKPGTVPSPVNLPRGCVFQARCPHVKPLCRMQSPALLPDDSGNAVACHHITH